MHSFGAKEWADKCEQLEATIADLQGQLLEWNRALHSLTPGGSEYANDSKACVEWVREARSRQHEAIIDGVKQRKDLQQRVAQLEGERDALKRDQFAAHACAKTFEQMSDEASLKRLLSALQADHARVLGLVQALPVCQPGLWNGDDGPGRKHYRLTAAYCDDNGYQELMMPLIPLLQYRASLPAQPAQGGAK